LLATGCVATGAPPPTKPPEAEVSTEEPAPTESPAETEVSPGDPSGEVTFITQTGEQFELIALTQAVNEFMARYPKIEVTCIIVVPVAGWDQGISTPCQIMVVQ
jgi:ABC-type glycerol-3-phosphate transport system substrate-binding protein